MEMICSRCGKESDKLRLPNGWKRKGDDIWCDKCWRAAYVLRAITVPIVEPLDGLNWTGLRETLREQWSQVTSASNWMMTEMYARDVRRNGQAKMPPMPKVYLYPEARVKFPALEPRTASSLEQAVAKKYRAARYKLIWTGEASLPTHRYPTPLPIHNQAWSIEIDGERPVLRARIGSDWLKMRLKGGARYRRQLAAIRAMATGDALRGELAILKAHDGEIRAKMVAWLPRGEARGADGTLFIRTDADSLLIGLNVKDETLWNYHADHLPRWTMEHKQRLQRWADDSKFEARPDPPLSAKREAAVRKYRNRMSSACHEAAAYVAGYAERRRFAIVKFTDQTHDFCAQFPWFRLTQLLREKVEGRGMEFEFASALAPEESGAPLAKEGTDDESDS